MRVSLNVGLRPAERLKRNYAAWLGAEGCCSGPRASCQGQSLGSVCGLQCEACGESCSAGGVNHDGVEVGRIDFLLPYLPFLGSDGRVRACLTVSLRKNCLRRWDESHGGATYHQMAKAATALAAGATSLLWGMEKPEVISPTLARVNCRSLTNEKLTN